MKDKYLVWILAGEASGDLYGAKLAHELYGMLPGKIRIAGMGSHRMRDAGVDIIVDSSELGIVGLFEVLKHIFTFIRIFLNLKRRAIKERPDAVVLIDYPGFNLRFAEQMYKNGIKVVWFISPQVWVWGKGRIPKLAKFCRKMLVIFPFETEVYKDTGLDCEFVGHPLLEIMKERQDSNIKRDMKKVLLLPGSRSDEIKRLLPPMLETISILHKRHPELTFATSAPRQKILDLIEKTKSQFCETRKDLELPEIEMSSGETTRWMQEAGTSLAASGTVTVECAIAGLPLVVIYKVSPITYWPGRLVIKKFYRNFFTMVNIILNRELFKEYLQFYDPETLAEDMENILPGGPRRTEVERGILEMRGMLSAGGENATHKAADAVMDVIVS